MVYAGIGSRRFPLKYIPLVKSIAGTLAGYGFTLRSGHADGADMAFEEGCNEAHGRKEIYLPWKNFNGSASKEIITENKDREFFIGLARKYHPGYEHLTQGAKKLIERNGCQVLGRDGKEPCDFIVCYTPDGSGRGGTGQALRIAEDYGIPIFDIGRYDKDYPADNPAGSYFNHYIEDKFWDFYEDGFLNRSIPFRTGYEK